MGSLLLFLLFLFLICLIPAGVYVIVLAVLKSWGSKRNTSHTRPPQDPTTSRSTGAPAACSDPDRAPHEPRTAANDAGIAGESYVKYVIVRAEPEEDRFIIHDFLARVENGSMQVDHIYINRNGVFVIETKSFAGLITGDEFADEWTQVMGQNDRTVNRLKNPIKQNIGHVKKIANILGRKDLCRNVVVILRASVQIKAPALVHSQDLKRLFTTPVATPLTKEEMESIYRALTDYQRTHAITMQEHLANVQRAKANHAANARRAEELIQRGICPQCGQKLALRTRDNGQSRFWGCEGFPQCRFFRKIDP